MYVFPNIECIFIFSVGNLSWLIAFQKLCAVFDTISIVHFY